MISKKYEAQYFKNELWDLVFDLCTLTLEKS